MWRITGYSSVIPLPPRIVRARAADLDRAADVAHLAEADVLGPQRALVLHAADVERDERGAVHLERHLGELLLGQLVGGDRLVEDDALLRVRERRLEAGAGGADGAEDDPVAGLVEAGERPAQASRPPGACSSAGTRTSSRTSSEVTEARSEIFLWISGAVKPGVPFSTRKPRISPSSVRAQTTATSAIEPFVIHILAPLRIQSEPSRRACVRIVPGSEPASGSVRPKQPITSPRCIARQPALLLLLRAPAPDRVHRERALHRDERCGSPESPASSSRHVSP